MDPKDIACSLRQYSPNPHNALRSWIFKLFRSGMRNKSPLFLHVSGECGGEHKKNEGFITSPGFPNNYPNGKECIHSIVVPDDKIVKLVFRRLIYFLDIFIRYFTIVEIVVEISSALSHETLFACFMFQYSCLLKTMCCIVFECTSMYLKLAYPALLEHKTLRRHLLTSLDHSICNAFAWSEVRFLLGSQMAFLILILQIESITGYG